MSKKLFIQSTDRKDVDIILLCLLSGVLEILQNNLEYADYFSDRIFSPYTLKILEEYGVSQAIIDLYHKCLFLEDYQSLGLSRNSFSNTIGEMKEIIKKEVDIISNSPNHGEKWIIL